MKGEICFVDLLCPKRFSTPDPDDPTIEKLYYI